MWFDEQPPEDVYFEVITRTNRTFGLVCMTFAPLKSILTVVWRFLLENVPDRADVQMIIEDAEHYFLEDCARITASYPPYEREARTKGVPALGSGRLFPIAGEKIGVAPEKKFEEGKQRAPNRLIGQTINASDAAQRDMSLCARIDADPKHFC
ncbi:hypothetical protein HKJ32_03025 [Xylella fastidiosa subsp. multiplex]|nr:hypothetical protein HKJ31_03370 [Xylella fastidiosa subsp. multiplex]QJP51600.1 hypothetical protein HKJ33_03375 [Xylella fastidiosa subsp. multiplex]QJP57118.1 hypothetical protein HKJ32_03025 [Xylella fastidiosa subsp. multiplex]